MKDARNRINLRAQIEETLKRTEYTYNAHHETIERLGKKSEAIMITQIVLTAISTFGFLTTLFGDSDIVLWIGGVSAAISLAINFYLMANKPTDLLRDHKGAADELWDVRESYYSLLTDFDSLEDEEIREKRERLQEKRSSINKKYPRASKKAYEQDKTKL